MPLPALYELVGQYRQLLDMDDIPAEQLVDTLDMIRGDIEEKCTNIGFVVRNRREATEAMRRAATQILGRANAYDNVTDGLLDYALTQLKAAGISKVEHPMLRMSIKRNPAKVVVDFEDSIPQEYMKQPEPPPPKPDKAAIREALQSGLDVAGAHLEWGDRLEIKS
jgi:hypothetical protein